MSLIPSFPDWLGWFCFVGLVLSGVRIVALEVERNHYQDKSRHWKDMCREVTRDKTKLEMKLRSHNAIR